jgi:hypothetical protein
MIVYSIVQWSPRIFAILRGPGEAGNFDRFVLT